MDRQVPSRSQTGHATRPARRKSRPTHGLVLFGAAFILALAAACATEPADQEEPGSELGEAAEDSATDATPGADTALIIGGPQNAAESQPPHAANVGMGFRDANASMFEGLVLMDQDFQIKPLLATDWEFVPPRTWRFELREGVAFHDGTPFNAETASYTINELWSERDANINPNSATAVEEYVLEITTDEPDYRFIEMIAHTTRAMQAPGTHAGDGRTPESTPTGTGPMRFVDYDEPTTLEVERFDDYWGELATVERINFRFIEDEQARVLALRAGEVDAIYNVPAAEAAVLEGEAGIQVLASDDGWYNGLHFHSQGEAPYDLLQERDLRLAIAHAIDKDVIIEGPWHGYAKPTNTIMPARILGEHADEIEGYPYDPSTSAEILDAAGWELADDGIRERDGRRLELLLVAGPTDVPRELAEVLVEQLRQIGIAVRVETPPDQVAYFDRVRAGEGDLYLHFGNQNTGNPILLGGSFTSVVPGGFSGHGEVFGPGPEYDAVVTEAFTTPVTTDEVRPLAAQAMRIIVDEYVASVPLVALSRIWAVQDYVHGFEPHPSQPWAMWHYVEVRG